MAARKKAVPADSPPAEISEDQEVIAMTDVDDVYEVESGAKRGRKADPLKAATNRLVKAQNVLSQVEAVADLPTREDAQAEVNAAWDALNARR